MEKIVLPIIIAIFLLACSVNETEIKKNKQFAQNGQNLSKSDTSPKPVVKTKKEKSKKVEPQIKKDVEQEPIIEELPKSMENTSAEKTEQVQDNESTAPKNDADIKGEKEKPATTTPEKEKSTGKNDKDEEDDDFLEDSEFDDDSEKSSEGSTDDTDFEDFSD